MHEPATPAPLRSRRAVPNRPCIVGSAPSAPRPLTWPARLAELCRRLYVRMLVRKA